MPSPVIAEVLRGLAIESQHYGAVAVVDANGDTVFGIGDVQRPIFPRSSVKAFHAMPLLETGAAERLGLSLAEIALAVGSHSGEPDHVRTALSMLGKAGQNPDRLECGAHWPLSSEAARALAGRGSTPISVHNSCSGEHSGFLCLASALAVDHLGYVAPDHRVQREVIASIECIVETKLGSDARGTDGCSIPTYAIPLRAIAHGFARFGTGQGIGPAKKKAAEQIRLAAARHPFMVAGTKRFDTMLMAALGSRAFVKAGAEGVHCAALPELGLGIAIKCDDGAGRAAEVVMAAVIQRFLSLSDVEAATVDQLGDRILRNWNGIEVGRVRAIGIRS